MKPRQGIASGPIRCWSAVARHRALEEAAARRAAVEAAASTPEQGGPKGPEPTRFGDWERAWA